jgi:rRNA pseudouridine-1189 N-methylase Emg1 (Nep1/Mra1 family)
MVLMSWYSQLSTLLFYPGTSFSSTKLVKMNDLVPKDEPVVVVIGAMAHGKVGHLETDHL